MNPIRRCDILLTLPYELVAIIVGFMDISSLFALSRVSKRYVSHKIVCTGTTFYPFRVKENIMDIRIDAISNRYTNFFKWFMPSLYYDCLSWDEKYPYIDKAIEYGQIDILKHLFYDGYPIA